MDAMNDPEVFRKHLNTNFVFDDPSGPLDLRLVDVEDQGVAHGVRQFSLFFHGPADRILPANTFSFRHDSLGQIDLFLGPVVGSNHERIVYQACFSVLMP
jgi:hypothetical protein